MHCPKCSAEVMEQAIYCHKCGERIQGEEKQFSPPPQPQPPAEDAKPTADSPDQTDPPPRPPAEPAVNNTFRDAVSSRQEAADLPEEELWQGGYSSKAMIGAWSLSGLISIAALTIAIWAQWSVLWWVFGIGVPALWIFQAVKLLYRRMNIRYWLTTQRFIHEQGIFRRITDRIEIIDMDDIAFEQSLLERTVGVGTISISSSDHSHPELHMLGIDKVKEVAGMIDDARRSERRRRGLHIESI
jgi:hypothetical protein